MAWTDDRVEILTNHAPRGETSGGEDERGETEGARETKNAVYSENSLRNI